MCFLLQLPHPRPLGILKVHLKIKNSLTSPLPSKFSLQITHPGIFLPPPQPARISHGCCGEPALWSREGGGVTGWPTATAIFRGACTPIMANVRNSWTSHNRLLGAGAASHTPMPLSLRSRLDQLRWTRAILELNLLFMDCVSISSIPLFLLSWFYALICNSTNCHNLPKNSSMEERIQRTWIFENYFSIVTHSIVFLLRFILNVFPSEVSVLIQITL